MKPEFQAKFLQHLNQRKPQDEGFTLIELLVVIIIIGILAAIALPSLLAQVAKAKQAEAKQNIGALNRAQQAYFLENQAFVVGAGSLSLLGVGIKSQTTNYSYRIDGDQGTSPGYAFNVGQANGVALKSYIGINATAIGDTTSSELLSIGFVCESNLPTTLVTSPTSNTTACQSITTGNYKDLGTK